MLFLCCTTYLFFQIFFLCWIYVVQHIRFSKFFSYVGFMLYNIFVFPIFFLIFVKKMLYNIWGFFFVLTQHLNFEYQSGGVAVVAAEIL